MSGTVNAQTTDEGWEAVVTEGEAQERHESAAVQVGDQFLLIGGRGLKPVNLYDPQSQTWTAGKAPPIEIHHFQAVEHDGLVYVLGALTGGYPFETPIPNILIYDPEQDLWIIGPEIPAHRRRGAAGVAVYEDRIYLVSGIVNGHRSHWVPWLDVFDPATNTWHELPDAPRSRDHFQAAVIDDKLYAAGGRRSGAGETTFAATVTEVDVYDFASETWTTLPDSSSHLPTPRAGSTTVVLDGELIVIGGESASQEDAHAEVEALNLETNTWRSLPSLLTGRHGMQAITTSHGLFIAAGCARRGGSPEIVKPEVLTVGDTTLPVGTPVVPGTLTALSVEPHGSDSLLVTLANTGGNQALVLTYALATGTGAVGNAPEFPYILRPGGVVQVTVGFDPAAEEAGSLLVRAMQRGGPVEVPLRAEGRGALVPILEEQNGIVTGEAEAFASQVNDQVRAWHVVRPDSTPEVGPDPDGNHAESASGGAYLEILPDTRTTHDDPLVHGVSFSNTPGRLGILTYYVYFNTPGQYYVWVRTNTSGTEDNGIHVGLNGTWPETGQRMQFDGNKQQWSWESRQRTEDVHTGVPELIFLEIDRPGVHTLSFSMREDGFEFDKWLLSTAYEQPEGEGPAVRMLEPLGQ